MHRTDRARPLDDIQVSPPRRSTRCWTRRMGTLLTRLSGYLALLLAWQLSSSHIFGSVTLPPPLTVLETMGEILTSGVLWPSIRHTGSTFLVVFIISYPLGVALGMLMGRSEYWNAFFRDYVIAGLLVPAVVFIFIGIMIFGLSPIGRVLAVCTGVIPLVVINVTEGVRSVDLQLIQMARVFEVTRPQQIRHVLLPAIAPFLFVAGRYAVAVGLRGSALVELFGAQQGMGYELRRTFDLYQIRGSIAWACYIVLIVLVIDRLMLRRFETRFFRWRSAS